jgi:hypothetical protein
MNREGRDIAAPAKARHYLGYLSGVLAAVAVLNGCAKAPEAAPQIEVANDAASPEPPAVPHGDHNPHHGGVVMMKGDLHYEVVLDPNGHHRVYFTDAVREDLPASIASTVTITIHHDHDGDEAIPLQIDDAGESWVGSGRLVSHPDRTTARVSFTVAGEPYWIDIPFAK